MRGAKKEELSKHGDAKATITSPANATAARPSVVVRSSYYKHGTALGARGQRSPSSRRRRRCRQGGGKAEVECCPPGTSAAAGLTFSSTVNTVTGPVEVSVQCPTELSWRGRVGRIASAATCRIACFMGRVASRGVGLVCRRKKVAAGAEGCPHL